MSTQTESEAERARLQGVYIGSVHSVKGLEFSTVYLLRCNADGDCPLPFGVPKIWPPSGPGPHPHLPELDVHLPDVRSLLLFACIAELRLPEAELHTTCYRVWVQADCVMMKAFGQGLPKGSVH